MFVVGEFLSSLFSLATVLMGAEGLVRAATPVKKVGG
jgi:hypothetical protein